MERVLTSTTHQPMAHGARHLLEKDLMPISIPFHTGMPEDPGWVNLTAKEFLTAHIRTTSKTFLRRVASMRTRSRSQVEMKNQLFQSPFLSFRKKGLSP